MPDEEVRRPSQDDQTRAFEAVRQAAQLLSPFYRMTRFEMVGLLELVRRISVDMKDGSFKDMACSLCDLAWHEDPQCKALKCPTK